MLHMKVKQCLNFQSGAFTVLVIYLAMIHTCKGESQVIGPSQPIVATVGDDIIFPCHLQPVMNAFEMTVEWLRPDLDPRFVFVWRDGVELQNKKHPSYEGRTSVFMDELKHGNISLKLSKVKLSDEGTYRCFVPYLSRSSTVKLFVGSVSSPVINMTTNSSLVVLQCESKGWYPEPEVFWLDGEGNLLSAGPTETVRGPDDLYTVSSRITVEKSNSFTCRVQQNNIKQIRETNIIVPDYFFRVQDQSGSSSSSRSSVPTIIVVMAVGFIFILAVVFVVWKWRQNKLKNKKYHKDEETQIVREKSNDPEQESLMEREPERETMKNVDKKINPLSEETRLQSQIEEETHQRKANNVLVQRQEGTLQQSVHEGTDLPLLVKVEPDQRLEEGETKTGLDQREEENKPTSEEAGAPGPAERETCQEQSKQKSINNDGAGQPQGTTGGEAKTDEEDEETKTQSTNNETAGQGPTEGETAAQQAGVETENSSDKREEETNTKATSEEAGAPGPAEQETQQEKLTEDERHQQQVMVGEEAMTNLENREEERRSINNEAGVQVLREGKRDQEQLMEDRQQENNLEKKEGEKKIKSPGDETELQFLQEEEKHGDTELDKERERLPKQQQTKEREEKKLEEKISRFMSNMKEQENKREQLSAQLEEVERKLQSLNSEKDEMDPETQTEAAEEEKRRLDTKKDLERKKAELQKDLQKTEKSLQRIKSDLTNATIKKNKLTKEKEEITEKLKEKQKTSQSESDEDL